MVSKNGKTISTKDSITNRFEENVEITPTKVKKNTFLTPENEVNKIKMQNSEDFERRNRSESDNFIFTKSVTFQNNNKGVDLEFNQKCTLDALEMKQQKRQQVIDKSREPADYVTKKSPYHEKQKLANSKYNGCSSSKRLPIEKTSNASYGANYNNKEYLSKKTNGGVPLKNNDSVLDKNLRKSTTPCRTHPKTSYNPIRNKKPSLDTAQLKKDNKFSNVKSKVECANGISSSYSKTRDAKEEKKQKMQYDNY